MASALTTDVIAPLPVERKDAFDAVHTEGGVEKGNSRAPLDTKFGNLTRRQVLRYFWRAILFCTIACWGGLNDGFQGALPGNILPLSGFVRTMADTSINGEPVISARVVSFFGGFPAMTQIFGQLSGGYIADSIGRKKAMILFTILFLLGSALSISAQNWRWWTGATCVSKLGLGIAQTTLIVYLAECAPFQLRGSAMAFYQLFLAGGQLVAAIGTQVQSSISHTAWRPLIASEFVITGLFCFMLPFLPESHIYHIRKGNEKAAKESMLRLYGTVPEFDVDYEYRVISEQIEAEREEQKRTGKSAYLEIFRGPNLRRTIAAIVGITAQPLAGAPLLFSYSTYYFSVAGLKNPFLVTVVIYAVLLVVIGLSMYLCEIVGRRPMMLSGCVLMTLFATGLGATGSFQGTADGKAALGMLLLWVIAYSWSAAPIGFIAAGETSSPRLRAQTSSVGFACYSSLFFIFYWTVPYMISPTAANLGTKAAYIFAGFLVPVTILVYFFYPETTGRTYVELDELYARGIPARKFASTSTSTEAQGLKSEAIITH